MLEHLKSRAVFLGKMSLVLVLFVLLVDFYLNLTSYFALAQTESIKGTVTFSSGEIVDGATVTLGNNDFFKQVASDSDGNYKFYDIPPGPYILFATGWAENKAGMFKAGVAVSSDSPLPLVINIVLSDSQPNS